MHALDGLRASPELEWFGRLWIDRSATDDIGIKSTAEYRIAKNSVRKHFK